MVVFSGIGFAQDQSQGQGGNPASETEGGPIYGSQLMTQQERLAYRNQLRTAQTEQERQQIRAQHHVLMQERAREHGLSLPDQPPDWGGGMGQGGAGRWGGGMGQSDPWQQGGGRGQGQGGRGGG
jgi:hypothetical protein